MTAREHNDSSRERTTPEVGRPGPACPSCGGATYFAGGEATHDLYAERFVCSSCGREIYRSFGRGSVS
jgi:ribosomal protein S27AE